MLYAVGAVLLAGWGWTALLGALVAAGFVAGSRVDGFDVAAADPFSWTVYLGTVTLAAGVGHALRHRAVLAEVRWAVALEAEQRRTDQLVVELERLSNEDPLTGLVNRRRWDEALDRARAGAGAVTVLLVDVDHFKSINDTGGHPAGDRALQQVAAALVSAVRSDDLVARLGGDEFGVLLCGLPPEAAGVIAEAVRERVESLAWAGLTVPVTLSIGLASAQGPGVDVPDLLRAADRMLYRAKTTRNAVVAELTPVSVPMPGPVPRGAVELVEAGGAGGAGVGDTCGRDAS
jgi:diguanylate cyclase (GGDEF)-like protein